MSLDCRLAGVVLATDAPDALMRQLVQDLGHVAVGANTLDAPGGLRLEIVSSAEPAIAALVFAVADLGEAEQWLRALHVRPAPVRGARPAFLDPHGLRFELCAAAPMTEMAGAADIRPAHLDMLVPDLGLQQRFYEDVLGFRTVSEYRAPDGQFTYLADAGYAEGGRDFLLEIVGPPGLEPREAAILAARGASYDHLCYQTADVSGRFATLTQAGFQPTIAPYAAFGGDLAWLRSAHLGAVDFELVRPISHRGFAAAIAGGPPVRRP